MIGTENGVIQRWDLRNQSAPAKQVQRSQAAISHLRAAAETSRYWIASDDGLLCLYDDEVNLEHYLTGIVFVQLSILECDADIGSDFDPIYDFAVSNIMLSACRDGVVRGYEL